ncbi:MAG: DUF655 domain-containing protein [Candidatus Bathyarchaeia archaeon]
MEREKRRYEEYAYVLDYLPTGKASGGRGFIAEPLVQMLGEEFFTLLEAVPRANLAMNPHEKVYIGKDRRDKIGHIIGRISYDELTPSGRSELPSVIEMIVKKDERKFVDFFNKAQSITPRMHAFELLPGIGKKYMLQILREREKKAFESFEDIQKRTTLPDPLRGVARRILDELAGREKYHIFTRPS